MTERAADDPWATYWRGRAGGSCVEASPAVSHALSELWRGFARTLPPRTRVLDLGTGGGAVLRELRRARPDLKLEGVDRSELPPSSDPALKLRGGVSMEALPHSAARFGAVVSQFGYEYAEPERAAAELGRVLTPGGVCALVVHRREGPVVRHNAARADALRWAVGADGPIARGRAIAAARGVAPGLPPPAPLLGLVQEARRLFDGRSPGVEIAAAALQAFDPSLPGHPVQTLDRLDAMARAELERLGALLRAARDAGGLARDAMLLAEAGVRTDAPQEVRAAGDPSAFAWLLTGRRTA